MRLLSIHFAGVPPLAKVEHDGEVFSLPLDATHDDVLRAVAQTAKAPEAEQLNADEVQLLADLERDYKRTVDKKYDTAHGRADEQISLQARMQPLQAKRRTAELVDELRKVVTPNPDTNKPQG